MPSFRIACVVFFFTLTRMAPGETFIRWNQAGYAPDRAIRLVIMSDTDLKGTTWRIEKGTQFIREGTVDPSSVGAGPHTPLAFNHTVELPRGLNETGTYRFLVADQTAEISVKENPYHDLLTQPLVHLQLVRSGPETVPPRSPSHPGDAHAKVWIPDGDPAEGKWKPDPRGRKVDVEGGWYDAGDQLKFTLNTAYTTTHLLLAWELAPHLFPEPTPGALPDILIEAGHGLEWLMKTHPTDDLFVVQVGDSRDHNQPFRLPEDDTLDGDRPALCALSRVHMHAAAGALARGAVVFKQVGRMDEARRYGDEAVRIFERAQGPGTRHTAFYRDVTNDFYHDDSLEDQLALSAISLHRWTKDSGCSDKDAAVIPCSRPSLLGRTSVDTRQETGFDTLTTGAVTTNQTRSDSLVHSVRPDRLDYLEIAIAAAPPADTEPSWRTWHWSANFALASSDPAAAVRLAEQADRHADRAANKGQPWGIPGAYVWAGLHRWTEMAMAAKLATLNEKGSGQSSNETTGDGPDPSLRERLFEDVVDYVFGRNSWGVSFLFSPDLPNSVQNIYSPMVHLLGIFPKGAFSEGPGSADTHQRLSQHFSIADDDPFHRFNTSEGVFFDNATDFMCQEATIIGQVNCLLLLTLATMD